MAENQTANVPEGAWLTTSEAARHCKLDRVTLYRARKRGELRAGGAGRAVRFQKSELDRWLRSGSHNDE